MTTAAQIAEQLGLTESGNGFTGFCPSCGYEKGFSVVDKNGRTLFRCHAGGCNQQEIIQALREYGLWGNEAPRPVEFSQRPVPSPKADSTEAAIGIWERAQPAHGTVVETYLRARGYLGTIPTSLRYVRGKHPSDEGFHPTMLAAALSLGEQPKLVGVHRTFLREDGTGKAALSPDKMSLGKLQGAGVPISAPSSKVAVSEGIETGLSVQQATGIPTIAALSAAGMQTLILPARVQEVFIAADPDDVGMKAAHSAARRWHADGRVVRIVKPPEGVDFNDLARRER
jgi:phage/plasmid primase-like uncharacterized protein